MSEFRIDPVSGECTIIASERAERPQDFKGTSGNIECSFCPGNEKMTPKSVMELKDFEEDENWSIRIIPNKYPFVKQENFFIKEDVSTKDSFYKNMEGYGIHDVVIDTPNHNESIVDFSQHHMENVFTALQKRQREIENNNNIKYVQIFKNQGVEAGASKSHSHWQIVGVSIVPEKQVKLIEGNKRYIKSKGICGYCDIIKHELELKERVIAMNENFIAITPYASKFPYEIWILPKRHYESFLMFDSIYIKDLTTLFQKVIKSLNLIFKDIDFNICFEGADLNSGNIHHWYLQIIPRIGSWAGFELGTSCYINIFSPELAAHNLRQKIDEEVLK